MYVSLRLIPPQAFKYSSSPSFFLLCPCCPSSLIIAITKHLPSNPTYFFLLTIFLFFPQESHLLPSSSPWLQLSSTRHEGDIPPGGGRGASVATRPLLLETWHHGLAGAPHAASPHARTPPPPESLPLPGNTDSSLTIQQVSTRK